MEREREGGMEKGRKGGVEREREKHTFGLTHLYITYIHTQRGTMTRSRRFGTRLHPFSYIFVLRDGEI